MGLIKEDGTIVANANSYVTVADANAYFALTNNTVWDALDPSDQKGPFLIQAVRFMQQRYRKRWAGYRTSSTQLLDWPRASVSKPDVGIGYAAYPSYYGIHEIPQEVKDAQCELALRMSNGDLNPDIAPEDMARSIKVGPIEIDFSPNGTTVTFFAAVEQLLYPLFDGGGQLTRIGRS